MADCVIHECSAHSPIPNALLCYYIIIVSNDNNIVYQDYFNSETIYRATKVVIVIGLNSAVNNSRYLSLQTGNGSSHRKSHTMKNSTLNVLGGGMWSLMNLEEFWYYRAK